MVAIIILICIGLAGCACQSAAKSDAVAQVIVKFKTPIAEPASADLLQDLAKTTQANVAHVRSMSGGAQIYLLSNVANDAALAQAIKALSARSDVEYAELDRKMKPQKGANE